MANISFTVSGADTGDITITQELSSTDATRIIQAYGQKYAPSANTPQLIVGAIATEISNQIFATVHQIETSNAVTAASSQVALIVPLSQTVGGEASSSS